MGLLFRRIGFQRRQCFFAFAIEEKNRSIGSGVLARPDFIPPLLGGFIHANRAPPEVDVVQFQGEQLTATQTRCGCQ
jgi:hypothetical protein